MIDQDTLLFVFAVLSYIITFITFYKNQKKEHDETIRKLQKIEDTQAEHGRRLDDHNHYAELFAQSSENNAKIQADVAYIKGKLESK